MRTLAVCRIQWTAMVGGMLAAALVGCQGPQPAGPQGPSEKLLDRLVAAYPEDLGTKHFQIIADFEEPQQAGLFRRSDGDANAVGISTAHAQQATGVGSLRMALGSPTQQVIVADSPQSQWALHQDWAPYNLLLMSVFSPRDQGGFHFSVTSGVNKPLVYEHSRMFLKTGWNVIRVDLAEMAEQIYLGDVREMRFWCDPLDSPIELYLDDIVLADNSVELLANEKKMTGELSVRAAGRRIVVTSAERFELTFNRGQLRQWFDLAGDPQRLHNLAGTGPLGPVPALLDAGGRPDQLVDTPSQWARLGPIAESYQTIVEASPVRVVIHGEWRFGRPDSPIDENSPYHRWIYSIYRGGEVYVEASGSIKPVEAQEVGLIFGCDGTAGFQRTIESPDAQAGKNAASYVLFSQPQQNGSADLLIVPSKPMAAEALESPNDVRSCVLYRAPVEAGQFLFTAMIRVWPNDIDTPTQAAPMALAYTRPAPIAVDTGSLLRTDPGDFDGDGYSEGRGYYVLQLDGRVAKVRLDGRDHLRFSPAFKLVDVGDYDVWAYVDGRQIKQMQRDQNGNLLFEVPGVISREILIEITASKKEAKTP